MSTQTQNVPKSKWKFKVPSAFTILFIVLILAVIGTWLIPSGSYSKLKYNSANKSFVVTNPHGEKSTLPATKETLDNLKVSIALEQFTEGKIRKPISVPDTYERLDSAPKSLLDIPEAMVHGTIQAADIMVFIFVLGGMIGVVNETGSFNAGLIALTKRTKGREFLLIFFVSIFMILGGTSCGLEEEAVAFYPILCPIFIALGYDSIISVGAIFLAGSLGTTYSTINPFAVVIASSAAGIPFTEGLIWRVIGLVAGSTVLIGYLYWYAKKIKQDPSFSYTYEDRADFNSRYATDLSNTDKYQFTLKRKIILTMFGIAFPLMVYGVIMWGWWFPQMAGSFLMIVIAMMFIAGLPEERILNAFMKGASSLVPVSLIIGLARAVNLVMEQGLISDTILYYASNMVSGMSSYTFIVALLFIFFLLGFIVPSSSGLAVLSMPIIAPLADTAGIDRSIIVSAYNWGQYAMLYLAPTGLVLATLQMLGMKYSHWFKFVWPIVLYTLGSGALMLCIQVAMAG
ncbi:MAG: YfcC family protein [Gammaproteobacteria bacterium]|nr:YfcC family protein [Gammaproteobacteria bacterium]